MKKLCNGWEFTPMWTNGFRLGEGEGEPVRLPHNPRPIPQHYAGPEDYEGVYGYRKTLALDETLRGKRLFLQFDGAAHIATVFVNGKELTTHRTGYTAFRVEITDAVRLDGTDLVAVRLDSTENPEIPPFGYVIDYLTYGGLYRDVWLDVRNPVCAANVFVQTPDLHNGEQNREQDQKDLALDQLFQFTTEEFHISGTSKFTFSILTNSPLSFSLNL